jgi:hypothetical protein
LSLEQKSRVKETILRCVDAFESGQIPHGLGLKKLQGDIWEVRAGLGLRVVFRREGDVIRWALAGTHDGIRRYLKRL